MSLIFVIADVQTPNLGAEFLQNFFGLLVDLRHKCLSDEVKWWGVSVPVAASNKVIAWVTFSVLIDC